MLRISLISTFGPKVRGISNYSDPLYHNLTEISPHTIDRIDFSQPYPAMLFPAQGALSSSEPFAFIHWANPYSWYRAAKTSGEIAHIQYVSPFSAYYLYAIAHCLRRQQKKIVITVHNPTPHEHMPAFGFFEAHLLRKADVLIAHTEAGRNMLLKRLPGFRGRVIVVPHGMAIHPETESTPIDYQLTGLSPSRRYVLMFGNLRAYKGVTTALSAWKKVIEENQDTDLVIAGRLWEGNSFFSRVVARLLGTAGTAGKIKSLLTDPVLHKRIVFMEGFIKDDIIDALCRVACIGLFPYERFSGQSGAATRAASWGLPLVLSDVGGLPALAVTPDAVVQPGQHHQLAGILLKLLSDRPRLHKLRADQTRHCRQFDWNTVSKQHVAVYEILRQESNL